MCTSKCANMQLNDVTSVCYHLLTGCVFVSYCDAVDTVPLFYGACIGFVVQYLLNLFFPAVVDDRKPSFILSA